jgi:putative ABC transport system permease protein
MANRGRRTAALAARLPLPRPASIGVAQPFARPKRMIAMVATVIFGTASVALAVGLTASLSLVEVARAHDSAAVTVDGRDRSPMDQLPPPTSPPRTAEPDAAAVTAAIAAQPGTTAIYGIYQAPATVAGLSGSVDVLAYTADTYVPGSACWSGARAEPPGTPSGSRQECIPPGFRMTEGRWFAAPGEAVVPTPLLTATATAIGDTISLYVNGHTIPVRIVGEAFSTKNDGLQVFTDLRTLTAVVPGLAPQEYRVDISSTVDVDKYVSDLDKALPPFGLHAGVNPGGHSDVLLALNTLTGLLTVMLVAVAALGVLNAVVLQTRERVRELGVHKAMGMTPRQAVTVVLASVVPVGLAGGVLGVPAGIAVHGVMVPAMGSSAGVRLPHSLLEVYHPGLVILLALGGVAIAVLGALMPAGWAARVRTATALRTE